MNKLCEICDTRIRLKKCNGREGDFKYCFRRVGSLENIEETITPFNSLHELYQKCKWLDWIIEDSMELQKESYGLNSVLLLGKEKNQFNIGKVLPIGYVTVDMNQWRERCNENN